MKKIFGGSVSFLFVLTICLMFGLSVGEAAANIQYKATEVTLQDGAVKIDGYYMNCGNTAGTVKDVSMDVSMEDMDGNPITAQEAVFGDVLCYVAAGAQVPWSFTMHNDEISAYEGQFQWHVHTHISWNNWDS